MKENGMSNLVQLLRKMVTVIETDDDFIGDFFQDGSNRIEISRIVTSQQDITQVIEYDFTLTQDGHGSLVIDCCHVKETIMDDNDSKAEHISQTRIVEFEKPKQNED